MWKGQKEPFLKSFVKDSRKMQQNKRWGTGMGGYSQEKDILCYFFIIVKCIRHPKELTITYICCEKGVFLFFFQMRGTTAFCMLMGMIQLRGEKLMMQEREDIYKNKVLEKVRKKWDPGASGGVGPR